MRTSISLMALIAFIFAYSPIHAQTYNLTTSTGAYQHLNNPTILFDTIGYTYTPESIQKFEPNIDFKIAGYSFDTLIVNSSSGVIHDNNPLGNAPYYYLSVYSGTSAGGGLSFTDEAIPNDSSYIAYTIEGAPGDRILKMEWREMQMANDLTQTTTGDYGSFQFWYYENDEHFEIRIGPNNVSDAVADQGELMIGLYIILDAGDELMYLWGDPNAPNLGGTNLTGAPAEGMIYQYNFNFLNNEENLISNAQVYPNPSNGDFTVNFQNEIPQLVQIYDMGGRLVEDIDQINSKIQLNLDSGEYILKLQYEDKMDTKKIVVL